MITPRKAQPVVISLDFGTSQHTHTQTHIHTHTHTRAKKQKSHAMRVMRVSSKGFSNTLGFSKY